MAKHPPTGRRHLTAAVLVWCCCCTAVLATDFVSPLCMAAGEGNVTVVVDILKDKELDVDDGCTFFGFLHPLQVAAKGDFVAVEALLLDHGAAVDVTNFLGYTPLLYAVENLHPSSVRLLLHHHANTTFTITGLDVLSLATVSYMQAVAFASDAEAAVYRTNFLAVTDHLFASCFDFVEFGDFSVIRLSDSNYDMEATYIVDRMNQSPPEGCAMIRGQGPAAAELQ